MGTVRDVAFRVGASQHSRAFGLGFIDAVEVELLPSGLDVGELDQLSRLLGEASAQTAQPLLTLSSHSEHRVLAVVAHAGDSPARP